MQIKRKIQLSAAAVVANGLLALIVMSPTPALAAGCSDNNYLAGCVCGVQCRTVPGCTSQQLCIQLICSGRPGQFCRYS